MMRSSSLKEGVMQNRWFWVVVCAAVGVFQSLDSGIAEAGTLAVVLAGIGIAAPVATIAANVDHGVRIAALVIGAILLVGARMVAPVPLNTLHLALFPAALYILLVKGLMPGVRRQAD
jgi:hypothetical protein